MKKNVAVTLMPKIVDQMIGWLEEILQSAMFNDHLAIV